MSAPWTGKHAEWIALVVLIIGTISVSAKENGATAGANGAFQDEIDDFVPYQGEKTNLFDWNLFQNMAKSHRGNLLISPISLKLALVLLYEGSQDETAQQLATVMHLPVGLSATRDRFSNILKSLQAKNSEYALNVGSRIYLDNSIMPRQRYAAIAKSFYSTDVLNTDFSNTRQSGEIINNFVKNITEGHIKTLISDDTKLKDSLMVIVSAMYFQGIWHRQPFSEKDTKIDKFYMSDGKTAIQVPFMKSSSKFYYAYANDLDAKILRIPYAGHKYAMFMILPQSPGKLDTLVKTITPFIISRHIWLMQELYVDVVIPKFKFDFTSVLENNLRELGIRDIFEDTATLTSILRSKTTSRRLVVSDILQKAGIEVNERGTVAYAATEIEIGNKMNDESFHANQPFLFYIEDENTGTILYMGLVNNPLEESGAIGTPVPQRPAPAVPVAPTQMPPRGGGEQQSNDAAGASGESVQHYHCEPRRFSTKNQFLCKTRAPSTKR